MCGLVAVPAFRDTLSPLYGCYQRSLRCNAMMRLPVLGRWAPCILQCNGVLSPTTPATAMACPPAACSTAQPGQRAFSGQGASTSGHVPFHSSEPPCDCSLQLLFRCPQASCPLRTHPKRVCHTTPKPAAAWSRGVLRTELSLSGHALHGSADALTNVLPCRRSEGSNNMLERSGWWQRYRLPRSVRVGAAVAGKGIVKGASVVRCAIEPSTSFGTHVSLTRRPFSPKIHGERGLGEG